MEHKDWSIEVSLEATIKVRLEVKEGRVENYAVTLVYIPEGMGDPENVILYDSAHGEIDCHRYWKSDDVKETKRFEGRTKRDAFKEAYEDIKDNWEYYLNLYKKNKG